MSNKEDVASLIRNYVHYDNLTSTFNKQTQNARAVRDDYEKRIIFELQKSKMENAIIQIVGGRLKIVQEKHSPPLSFKNLEESLHDYYFQMKKVDETPELIKFIKANRTVETDLRIKKIHQLPPQPEVQKTLEKAPVQKTLDKPTVQKTSQPVTSLRTLPQGLNNK